MTQNQISPAAPARPDWIAVDWGTSNMRAWAMSGRGTAATVLAEAQSDEGMGRLTPEGFEPALLRLIEPWLAPDRVTEVLACGMVGARQGWVEAAYRPVPCKPAEAGAATKVAARDPRIAVSILPGLSQRKPSADVMRGEETQIAGLIAREREFDGVVCLPGTHTKWAHVSAEEVVSFQTFMTGELFALLSGQSVLRHSLAGEGWDEAAFDAAVSDAMSNPARLSQRLFALRAESLLDALPPAAARARLSGLLIGIELAAARPYWLGQRVAIIGAGGLSGAYARALGAQGVVAERHEAGGTTRAGLALAREGAQA